MIISVFSQYSTECIVLVNANRSAQMQIFQTFASFGQDYSTGIPMRTKQCSGCSKMFDDEARMR